MLLFSSKPIDSILINTLLLLMLHNCLGQESCGTITCASDKYIFENDGLCSCMDCTVCTSEEYQFRDCRENSESELSLTSDRVCNACGTCTPLTNYGVMTERYELNDCQEPDVTWPRQCDWCASPPSEDDEFFTYIVHTPCKAGGNEQINRVWKKCTTCATEEYLVGCNTTHVGTCLACTTCTNDEEEIVPCNLFDDDNGRNLEINRICEKCTVEPIESDTFTFLPNGDCGWQCNVGYFAHYYDGANHCDLCNVVQDCEDEYGIERYRETCTAGSTTDAVCILEEGRCVDCSPGMYLALLGDRKCQECDAGTFTNQTGQTSCKTCPIGTSQANSGRDICPLCVPGTFQDETGQYECKSCQPGFFTDTHGQFQCQPCDAGKYQNKFGGDRCEACEVGSSSLQRSSSCTKCAPGTYGMLVNKTTASNPQGSWLAICVQCVDPVDDTIYWTGEYEGAKNEEEAGCHPMQVQCTDCDATICPVGQFLYDCGWRGQKGKCATCRTCHDNHYRTGCSQQTTVGECSECKQCNATQYSKIRCYYLTNRECDECINLPCEELNQQRIECGNGNHGRCVTKLPVANFKITDVSVLGVEIEWTDGHPTGDPFELSIKSPGGETYFMTVTNTNRIIFPSVGSVFVSNQGNNFTKFISSTPYTFTVRGNDPDKFSEYIWPDSPLPSRRLLASDTPSEYNHTVLDGPSRVADLYSCNLRETSTMEMTSGVRCQPREFVNTLRISWGNVSHYGYHDMGKTVIPILGYRFNWSTSVDTLHQNTSFCAITEDEISQDIPYGQCFANTSWGFTYIPDVGRGEEYFVAVAAVTFVGAGEYSIIAGAIAPRQPSAVQNMTRIVQLSPDPIFPHILVNFIAPIDTGAGDNVQYAMLEYIIHISFDETFPDESTITYSVSNDNNDITSVSDQLEWDSTRHSTFIQDLHSIYQNNVTAPQFKFRLIGFNNVTGFFISDPLYNTSFQSLLPYSNHYGLPSKTLISPDKTAGNCSIFRTDCNSDDFMMPQCFEAAKTWLHVPEFSCFTCTTDQTHPTCGVDILPTSTSNETYISGCGFGVIGDCTPCSTCSFSEYTTVQCRGGVTNSGNFVDNTQDRVCDQCSNIDCGDNKFLTGCGDGYPGTCATCNVCPNDFYIEQECTNFEDIECISCQLLQTCTETPGYFLHNCGIHNVSEIANNNGTCKLCTDSCDADHDYIVSHCTHDTPHVCASCASLSCPENQYRIECGGTFNNFSQGTCVPCTPITTPCEGHSSQTPMFINLNCSVTQDRVCGYCNQSDLLSGCDAHLNSKHLVGCGVDNAPGTCVPCSNPECDPGFFKSGTCSQTTDYTCADCNQINCSNPNKYLHGCGSESAAGVCQNCISICTTQSYLWKPCSSHANSECNSCSNTDDDPTLICETGKFRSGCGVPHSTKGICANCSQCSSSSTESEYTSTACTWNTDTICSSCLDTPECPSAHFRKDCGMNINNTLSIGVCTPCSSILCNGAAEYVAQQCSKLVDKTCGACSEFSCALGSYREGCGASSDGVCVSCETIQCDNLQYRDGCGTEPEMSQGICRNCTTTSCEIGFFESTSCGLLNDRICTPYVTSSTTPSPTSTTTPTEISTTPPTEISTTTPTETPTTTPTETPTTTPTETPTTTPTETPTTTPTETPTTTPTETPTTTPTETLTTTPTETPTTTPTETPTTTPTEIPTTTPTETPTTTPTETPTTTPTETPTTTPTEIPTTTPTETPTTTPTETPTTTPTETPTTTPTETPTTTPTPTSSTTPTPTSHTTPTPTSSTTPTLPSSTTLFIIPSTTPSPTSILNSTTTSPAPTLPTARVLSLVNETFIPSTIEVIAWVSTGVTVLVFITIIIFISLYITFKDKDVLINTLTPGSFLKSIFVTNSVTSELKKPISKHTNQINEKIKTSHMINDGFRLKDLYILLMARIRSIKKTVVIPSKLSITKEVMEIDSVPDDTYNIDRVSNMRYNCGANTFQPNGAPIIVAKSRKLYGIELNHVKTRKDITDFAMSVKDKSIKES
jgi:hypothetical protein